MEICNNPNMGRLILLEAERKYGKNVINAYYSPEGQWYVTLKGNKTMAVFNTLMNFRYSFFFEEVKHYAHQ